MHPQLIHWQARDCSVTLCHLVAPRSNDNKHESSHELGVPQSGRKDRVVMGVHGHDALSAY